MLVHRRARRQGIGAALMQAAEATARDCGKTLLVLDTASDDAERLYERQGWVRVGAIPGYALLPRGRPPRRRRPPSLSIIFPTRSPDRAKLWRAVPAARVDSRFPRSTTRSRRR